MKNLLLFAVASPATEALELNGKLPIYITGGADSRTFQQLEDFAAEIWNLEFGSDFTGHSWTQEFMEYGCYCNKVVRGGGKLPGNDKNDVHENLCMDLYKCYKCINIDYDHEGTYAATEMVYNATRSGQEDFISCLDPLHHPVSAGARHHPSEELGTAINPDNCPRHVCECDKHFIATLLENYKKCLAGNQKFCLKDKYRYSNGWEPKNQCEGIHDNQMDHDECCGEYPERKPLNSTFQACCDNHVIGDTVC